MEKQEVISKLQQEMINIVKNDVFEKEDLDSIQMFHDHSLFFLVKQIIITLQPHQKVQFKEIMI